MGVYRLYVDTEDGELCYEGVDIGDGELVGDFLDGIVKELDEGGVTVAGSSAGDLRLIWNEQELDLSSTLPEQGVAPNDTLRILAETFEGGGIGLRQTLIGSDLGMLKDLASLNPETLRIVNIDNRNLEEKVEVQILGTPGVEKLTPDGPVLRNEHRFRFVFPRFYPEMAIACYCIDPLFHPNVSPETSFFCLWARFSPLENNIVQAVCRAQAATALRIVNIRKEHWMNPQAAQWYLERGSNSRERAFRYRQLITFRVSDDKIQWVDPNDVKNRLKSKRLVRAQR